MHKRRHGEGEPVRCSASPMAGSCRLTVIQFTPAVINVLYITMAVRQNGGLLCRPKNIRKNFFALFSRPRQAVFSLLMRRAV